MSETSPGSFLRRLLSFVTARSSSACMRWYHNFYLTMPMKIRQLFPKTPLALQAAARKLNVSALAGSINLETLGVFEFAAQTNAPKMQEILTEALY